MLIRNAAIDPTRDHPGEWTAEDEAAALARCPAVGLEFFSRLGDVHPRVRGALVFLHWQGQPDDVYAVYDAPHGFTVQIDPDMDYVIIGNGSSHGEYAQWGPDDDPVASALAHVALILGTSADG